MRDDGIEERADIGSDKPMSVKTQISSQNGRLSLPLSVRLKRVLREPLAHFLLIGLVLFAAYSVLNPGIGQGGSSTQITLTEDDLRQLYIAFAAKWKRPPTPEEMTGLIDSRIREEVLYREALALGLDKEDTIVKRRMAQKMEFLVEDLSDISEPTTEELKAWFEKNADLFAWPSRMSFRHLYFSPDLRGRSAYDDAVKALEKIEAQPEDSKLAASLADQFMFQDYYGDRTTEQLAKEFGPQFAVAVSKLKPGSWQGPVESGYGWHLVFVDSATPGRIPAFEEIEPDVKTAWLGEQKQKARQEAYEAIRDKYTVLLPAPPEKESAQLPDTNNNDQVSALAGETPE